MSKPSDAQGNQLTLMSLLCLNRVLTSSAIAMPTSRAVSGLRVEWRTQWTIPYTTAIAGGVRVANVRGIQKELGP